MVRVVSHILEREEAEMPKEIVYVQESEVRDHASIANISL
jgi:hypothetical protein